MFGFKKILSKSRKSVLTEWTRYRIPVCFDGGGAEMDVRYIDGAVQFKINGNNEFELTTDDAILLIRAMSEVIPEGMKEEMM